MATRKILFVLSLALFINSALHCMDNMENEDTENSNKELTALGFGLLSLTAAIYISNKFLIEPKKQKLLHESQNVEVFTSSRISDGQQYNIQYRIFKTTGTQLHLYGIFDVSNYEIRFTESKWNSFLNSSDHHNRKLKILYGKLINRLLPNWFELLLGKVKYNLDDANKITEAIRNCIKTMAINGSVVLMTPPDFLAKRKTKRKTLVVHSDNSDCQVFSFFNNGHETLPQLEKIKQGIFKYTDEDLSDNIILATKNILQQDLEKALKNDSTFSNVLLPINLTYESGTFVSKTPKIRKAMKQYQQNIIDQVFPENDGSSSKEGKAILMIPLQNSYYELKIKNYSF